MFDWLGDILSGLGDALSVVFEGVGADIAVDIWNALVEWIYNTVFDAVADLFTSMNNMGAEIFSLSWVNAVVRLFTLFGWALFTVGVVGAVFEVAIESQSGRVSIKGAALNVLKGFFACALIGVLPVELYGATTPAVAMLSKPWKTVGSMQRTFIRCSLSFMKSLTSALLRRRRTTTKIGNTDLGPSWPEAWRRTKGQHSLPGAVLSLFPTGTMREMLAVNQLRKGGFNGTIRYLSE